MATEKPVTPTEEQLEILEYNFCKVNKHPDPTTLCLIAAETGLSEEQTLVSVRPLHASGYESQAGKCQHLAFPREGCWYNIHCTDSPWLKWKRRPLLYCVLVRGRYHCLFEAARRQYP
uniref:Homeodomain-only protein n=1 Tax=Otus sunia TaxID=257818 RepID=A0A8C8E808_9STRI